LLLLFLIFNFFFDRNNGNCSPEANGSPNEADRKRVKKSYRSKSYKVEISFASKIPLQAIANALKGHETENYQEAIRVLDIILRQHAAKQCVVFLPIYAFLFSLS
jgi:eukaryotic translation initiation factor 2C